MYGNHRDNIDDDYSSVRELHGNKYKKKEPYVFTITATNAVGDSVVSDPTSDIVPNIKPTLTYNAIGPVITNNEPSLICMVEYLINGSSITKLDLKETDGTNNLTIIPSQIASNNSSGLNYFNLRNVGTTKQSISFNVKGFEMGKSYSYNLTATNSAGESDAFPVRFTTYKLPDVPSITQVDSGDKQCTISFTTTPVITNTVNNLTVPIYTYTVKSSPENITATGSTSPITIGGLTNGTKYTFTVTATNQLGTTQPSAASSEVIPKGAAIAPTSITAVSGDIKKSTVIFSGGSSNGDTSVKYTITTIPDNITATGNSSPIIVTGLKDGTTYTFNIKAENTIGSSTSSQTATATTADKPSKITTLTPTAGANQITLTFPNQDGITEYKILAYYTNNNDNTKTNFETIKVPITAPNCKIDNNNVVITLYTKSNNAIFKSGSSMSGAIEITNADKTISTSVQPYARVPLSTYPIGRERTLLSMENCYNYGILLFVLIFIAILWNCSHKRK
jgi:hypothetical protein